MASSIGSQFEGVIAKEAAGLGAVQDSLDQAPALFKTTIDSFHQAGDVGNGPATLADLAVFFDRYEQPENAATICGSPTPAHEHRDGAQSA